MTQPSFEQLLLEAIDEALGSLGQSSKQAIYYHLEKGFKIQKQQIPFAVEEFALAVEKIFGIGANFLEKLILKVLYEKTDLQGKENLFESLSFAETAVTVKRTMEK